MGCGKGPPAEHRSTLSSPLNPPPLREAAERGHPRPSLLDQCPSRSCLWDFSAFCCVTLYTLLFLGSLLRRGLCTSALAVVLRTGNILLLRDWQIIPYRRIWDAVPYLLPERPFSAVRFKRKELPIPTVEKRLRVVGLSYGMVGGNNIFFVHTHRFPLESRRYLRY